MRAFTPCSTSGRASRSWSASPRRRPARRSISIAPSARRRCCARRSSAIRGRCAMRKSRACFAKSCPPVSRSRSRSRSHSSGPEGTFTQAAVLKHFGSSVRALPLPAIDEVFHEVEGGVADFGVVPIENSSEGTVNHTLDMFLGSAVEDLRRSGAAHQSSPDGPHERHGRRQARVRAHPGAGAMPRLAGRSLAGRRARRRIEQCRRRAPRAR